MKNIMTKQRNIEKDLESLHVQTNKYKSVVLSFKRIVHTLFDRLEFILDNGYLKHTMSGKCVKPTGAVTNGIALGLYTTCDGHQFSFTTGGSLQHIASKKCVNTKTGVSEQFLRHILSKSTINCS